MAIALGDTVTLQGGGWAGEVCEVMRLDEVGTAAFATAPTALPLATAASSSAHHDALPLACAVPELTTDTPARHATIPRLGLRGAHSFKRQRTLPGHAIAAVRAFKSSLSARTGGKGPEIRPPKRLFAGLLRGYWARDGGSSERAAALRAELACVRRSPSIIS